MEIRIHIKGAGRRHGRITQKVFDGICAAVEDRETAFAMTESEDSVQLVTGLWAIGFYEVRDAVVRMREIARTGSRNRRLALAYYNSGIWHSAFSGAVAIQMLETYPEDPEIAAAFLSTYLPGSDSMVSDAIRRPPRSCPRSCFLPRIRRSKIRIFWNRSGEQCPEGELRNPLSGMPLPGRKDLK